ncbi:hypothetical protein [Eikenella sp. Marseille-P7795]|nr:hypothetical protein [Eikenella sp. Marseille-P7795]
MNKNNIMFLYPYSETMPPWPKTLVCSAAVGALYWLVVTQGWLGHGF